MPKVPTMNSVPGWRIEGLNGMKHLYKIVRKA